jgi:putative addiction module killer protein
MMIEVRLSAIFSKWLDGLRDHEARSRVLVRIRRFELGNPGDVKSIGDGVSELRIAYGPGYRVYFTRQGTTIVILLCGGDKASQRRDIALAKQMTKEL